MTGAQTLPPRIAAGAEARDLELDFCAEQLSFLAVEISIARGYVDLANDSGLAYSVRQMKARMQAIVEAEGRLYKMLRERLRAEAPTILEQGRNAAALGEAALNAYWRGLTEDQKTAVERMQRVAWRQTAVRADQDRAARDIEVVSTTSTKEGVETSSSKLGAETIKVGDVETSPSIAMRQAEVAA